MKIAAFFFVSEASCRRPFFVTEASCRRFHTNELGKVQDLRLARQTAAIYTAARCIRYCQMLPQLRVLNLHHLELQRSLGHVDIGYIAHFLTQQSTTDRAGD